MRRLILLRHGEAEASAASGDVGRALTPRGREDARRMGEALARRGFAPDLALVSSARRARETWDEAGLAFPHARAKSTPSLYDATPRALMAAAEAEDAECVVLVGHNPGMHQLAVELASKGGGALPAGAGFPPAAAAAFSFEDGIPALEALMTPDSLGSGRP